MGRRSRRRHRRAPTSTQPPRPRGRRRSRGLRRHLPPAVRRYVPRWGSRRANRVVVGAAVGVMALALLLALLPQQWPRTMLVTAYCPCAACCGPNARGVTASGRPVSANGGRFVAADRGIPFGTMLVVPGYNDGRPVEVLDRGGAIKGDHIDVFFPSHEQAKRWGA